MLIKSFLKRHLRDNIFSRVKFNYYFRGDIPLLSKLISKKRKNYYRFVLILIFMFVGFVISATSIVVSGYYQLNALNKELNESAEATLFSKKKFMQTQINNFKNYIVTIDKTSEFNDFLKTSQIDKVHAKEHLISIMMAVVNSDANVMKFRFIDKEGFEVIRINRDAVNKSPYLTDAKSLQDKSNRYYFQELRKVPKDRVWFSDIDLNMEYGEIMQPVTPTLRIAKSYYVNNEFKGTLIISIFMNELLNEIVNSELFNISVIDKESYLLASNLKTNKEDTRKWAKYLKEREDVKYTVAKSNFLLALLFPKRYFDAELSDVIQNDEGIKIVLEKRIEKLLDYAKDIIDYMLVMSIIVFAISFPIAAILSRYPLRQHEELKNTKEKLEQELDIIDKYVYMTKTDLEGDITYVSEAFSKLSGYSKDELMGKNHRILKSPEYPSSYFTKMWDTLLEGKSWESSIKNIAKNGNAFWVSNHITPIIDDGKITGFTAIRENITDQKIIEEISIKDELTQAYNRRYFNQIFAKELNSAKRKGYMFCVAMFDIDYFKKYNDTYGHIKGDEVLKSVVNKVSANLQRGGDYLFRVGGEEFIIIYSGMKSLEEAEEFSSKVVISVEALDIEHKTSLNSNVLTISLGLLNITPECDIDEDAILKRVDELLYRAKEGGRNRVVSQEC